MKRVVKSKQFISVVSVGLILLIVLASMAFDPRSGTNVAIPGSEVVNGDPYVTGTNVTIESMRRSGAAAVIPPPS
jgi:hypothetical protein